MNFENLQNAIQMAEIEIKNIQSRGEKCVFDFLKLIPEFLSEWASILVKNNVEKNPLIVKSLGIEKISILKKKILDFDRSLPALTKKQLEATRWPHQIDLSNEELKKIYPSDLEKIITNSLDDAIRAIIGHLGTLLVEFGLTKVGQYSEWKETNGKIFYAYGIPDQYGGGVKGPQLKALKEKYREIIELYVGGLRDLKKAEEDKRIAEAKSIWDKA
jgi:hypothetical protein